MATGRMHNDKMNLACVKCYQNIEDSNPDKDKIKVVCINCYKKLEEKAMCWRLMISSILKHDFDNDMSEDEEEEEEEGYLEEDAIIPMSKHESDTGKTETNNVSRIMCPETDSTKPNHHNESERKKDSIHVATN
jgi:hypothetical protein